MGTILTTAAETCSSGWGTDMRQVEIIKTIGNGRALIVHSETDDGQPVQHITLSTDRPLSLVDDADKDQGTIYA